MRNRAVCFAETIALFCWCASVVPLHGQAMNGARQYIEESEGRRYAMLREALLEPQSAPDIDVQYYKVDISITTSPPYLRGVVTMRARSKADSLTSVTLNLMSQMTVDSIKAGGALLSSFQQSTTVTFMLERSINASELFNVDIYYQGNPLTPVGFFSFASHGNKPWVWSLSEPYGARYWWPCKDHPSDKADSVDIWVTVDSTLKVGSNGLLAGVVHNGNGTTTYQWAERYPISTYLVSLAATDYAEAVDWFTYSPTDSMPVLHYVLPEHLAASRADLNSTVGMLRIYSDLFGLYPFIKEKYGHAEWLPGWGGMEHQTMTSIDRFDSLLVSHELAHQWFGDMITCATWPDLWLNEGFATYSTGLYYERHSGKASYTTYMRTIMDGAKMASGTLFLSDTANVGNMFNWNRVYAKGAAVLHMLRHVLGDSIFFRALKTYAQDSRFRFGVATTEDFKQVCETVSGKQLGYFFDEWIYGSGYPKYLVVWEANTAATGYDVSLRVLQQRPPLYPPAFTMPIDISLSSAGWDTTVVLMNDSIDQRFSIPASHRPSAVALDPGMWILRDVVASVGTAYLAVNHEYLALGPIPESLAILDTTFVVRNLGLVGDTVKATVLPGYFSPDSAVSLFPATFWLAPGDSQKVTCRIRPRLLAPQTRYKVWFQLDAQTGVFETQTQFITLRIIFDIVTSAAGDGEEIPSHFMLRQNYPNPFNPSTTIKYEVPKSSIVRLSVFDMLGREVSVLVNERRDAGVHEVQFDASALSSGVYFYRLQARDFVASKRMLILK